MIQLRHVPDRVHGKLKARAALKGLSLSDYLVHEVTEIAAQPTMDEFLERLATRQSVTLKEPAAVTVRRGREGR